MIYPWEEASSEQKVAITAIAMEDFAVIQALVTIHGEKRGTSRYAELGGRVRFHEGDPVVWHEDRWWRLPSKKAEQ